MFETSYLLISLVFSSIGLGYFIYGKKQKKKPVYFSGLGLMLFPYVVTDTTQMLILGTFLLALPKILQRFDIG